MSKQINEQTVYSRSVGMDLRQSYDANGRIEYIGYAYPKATDSQEKWQIMKCKYDSNGRLTHRRFADGNDKYDKIWDNRSSYNFTDI